MASEQGQATVEWTSLVLLTALATAALTALVARVDGRGMGESVAHAITCAARGGCAARPPPAVDERPEPRPVPPVRPKVPAEVPAARPEVPAARPEVPAARAAAAFRTLRGVADVAKKAWIVCLGYRRYRYEVEHPRLPTEAMPMEEALDIANECVNPLGFLVGD
ncbi:MAG TPA: hypothetical protein VI122_18125 [Thermoleophilaceae bacterium]